MINIIFYKVFFKRRILYFSRSPIPFNFKKKQNFYKQLSVISFKPNALQEFAKNKITNLEKVENIELIRSIELSQKIGTFLSKSKSFSIDTYQDLMKARKLLKK